MEKIGTLKEAEAALIKIKESGSKPALLLHSCCAPCSTSVLLYLLEYFKISMFFYNPNISPESEYIRRVEEQKRLIKDMGLAKEIVFLEGDYHPQFFYDSVRGLEGEKEGGKRCELCFRMRLLAARDMAKARKAAFFTTTLSLSPHKNAALLNEIGQEIEEEGGPRYLYSDFKKKDGYKQSVLLSKQYSLYRQDYCGCIFSKKEREERNAEV